MIRAKMRKFGEHVARESAMMRRAPLDLHPRGRGAARGRVGGPGLKRLVMPGHAWSCLVMPGHAGSWTHKFVRSEHTRSDPGFANRDIFDVVTGNEYRDRIAAYVNEHFSSHGLVVYTEVGLGKTIIGKRRRIDVFVRNQANTLALGIECKYQASSGTTDEKVPYALADLEAMWIPGCLAYAGEGWSRGVLHTLEGSRNAVFCDPPASGQRDTAKTVELDHVLASVFGLWSVVIPEARRFASESQLTLPGAGLQRVTSDRPKKRKTSKAGSD